MKKFLSIILVVFLVVSCKVGNDRTVDYVPQPTAQPTVQSPAPSQIYPTPNFYVSSTGSDGNPGTSSSPWRTIGKANNTLTACGTVLIRAGTYNETIRPTNSGSAGCPITYIGENGTVLNGQTNNINITGKQYINIFHIAARNPTSRWAVIDNSQNIVIADGSFDALESSTVGYQGFFVVYSNHVTLRNTAFGTWGTPTGEWGDEINLSNSEYLLLEKLEMCNARSGHGLIGSSKIKYVIIRDSCFLNNWQKDLGIAGTVGGVEYGHNLIENNVIYNSGFNAGAGKGGVGYQSSAGWTIFRFNRLAGSYTSGSHYSIFNDAGTIYNGYPHNRTYNNVYYSNGVGAASGEASGLEVVQYSVTSNIADIGDGWFVNNILMDNAPVLGQQVILRYLPGGLGDQHFVNNLFYESNGKASLIYDSSGGNKTIAVRNSSQPANFSGNREVNPLFVDAAGRNFQLQSNSPAIDAGADLTKATNTGVNSIILTVVDALYFTAGFGMIAGDTIRIGAGAPVQIVSINGNTITLSETRTWSPGNPVNLNYAGDGPDMGAFEYGGSAPPTLTPAPPTITATVTQTPSPRPPTPTRTATVTKTATLPPTVTYTPKPPTSTPLPPVTVTASVTPTLITKTPTPIPVTPTPTPPPTFRCWPDWLWRYFGICWRRY